MMYKKINRFSCTLNTKLWRFGFRRRWREWGNTEAASTTELNSHHLSQRWSGLSCGYQIFVPSLFLVTRSTRCNLCCVRCLLNASRFIVLQLRRQCNTFNKSELSKCVITQPVFCFASAGVFLSRCTHSDTDPRLLEKQEQQQPTYVALSYINRWEVDLLSRHFPHWFFFSQF